jgi:Kef-type K+ transport system membrane component KefB
MAGWTAGGYPVPIADALLTITALLVSAHLLGGLTSRLGLPAVVGELLAGVLLGAIWFGSIGPDDPLYVFAEVGLILLMVSVAMETDPSNLLKAGPQAIVTSVLAIGLPFLGTLVVGRAMGLTSLEALMMAAALSATGVTVLVRVLREAGALAGREASLLLAIALLADLIGLVILGVVRQVAEAGAADLVVIIRAAMVGLAFLVGAFVLGGRLSRLLERLGDWHPADGAVVVLSVSFALAVAVAARLGGSAIIVGAFAAGILLARTRRSAELTALLHPVGEVFIPLFFAIAGTGVRFASGSSEQGDGLYFTGLTAVLFAVVVAGKALAGLAVARRGIRRLPVAIGLVPCGAVGMAFAEVGRQTGVLSEPLFSTTMVIVALTTFVGLPLFKRALG